VPGVIDVPGQSYIIDGGMTQQVVQLPASS
jgi:hypothetical protein